MIAIQTTVQELYSFQIVICGCETNKTPPPQRNKEIGSPHLGIIELQAREEGH
jgi:hypothetical protein